MKILITEDQKKEIIKKYQGEINNDIMTYLRRHYPVFSIDPKLGLTQFYGNKGILVDEKVYPIKENKNLLTNIISAEIVDEFIDLGIPTIRKTVKTYLDYIANS